MNQEEASQSLLAFIETQQEEMPKPQELLMKNQQEFLVHTLAKSDGEDFVAFAYKVYKQCEDFKINQMTPDQFKSLIFICGLHSVRDAEIRTRLLSKVEKTGSENTYKIYY
ncbi:hypothetical protein JTB14_013605 [Gonioctena quinquepunctata]|nr:hypothetical protein JTB14_013605 [Gonioctena quinquepunctata]